MPSLLSRYQQDASSRSLLALPILLFAASILANLGTAAKHSILTSAVAWLSICTYCTLRTGAKTLLDVGPAKKIAWVAGGLFALAQVCERAVEGRGIWWAKALLPAIIYAATEAQLLNYGANNAAESLRIAEKTSTAPIAGSKTSLSVLTVCALAAVYTSSGSNTAIAIGLSYAVVTATGYLLVERASAVAQHARGNTGSVIYSANGFLAQPASAERDGNTSTAFDDIARDVSAAATLLLGIAACTFESWRFDGVFSLDMTEQAMGKQLDVGQSISSFVYALGVVLVHMALYSSLLLMISRQSAVFASLIPLYAAVSSQLVIGFSASRLWFAALSASSAFAFLDEKEALGPRRAMRAIRLLTLTTVLSFALLAVLHLRQPLAGSVAEGLDPLPKDGFSFAPAPEPLQPLQYTDTHVHPVDQLVRNAEAAWMKKLNAQSKSLDAAVTEYKRRYKIPPPPNFDKWFEFAKRKNVQLIDEYDTIYHSLLPFWALSPATIRARVREALGFGPNNLIGLLLRDGKAEHVEGGQEWQQEATIGMMEHFVQYLPDMDLAFNIHDEPRVVVPHDELSRLVQTALNDTMPAAFAAAFPRNKFSARPKDVKSGKRIAEVKTTRFNVFAHQPTWIPSRMSCSLDSPSRALDETHCTDNLTAYALGDLGFIYNQTAFSDICNSPSFGTSHGFFDRPNAFNVVHELFPIFSQSKMSSFQDILYPSPWYWFGKVSYEEEKDLDWKQKESRLWWRGSTTGGFSRDGGWRRQHRQQFVRKMNALDQARILDNTNKDSTESIPQWEMKEVPRQDFKEIMDVHFSGVGQCDPGDCDAQREFFDVVAPADQQEAWKFKYLLDIDGNAFSGRFYAFLKSHSLTFKMAVFREWHEEWIKPWVHYIPLSLRGDEGLEAVRYFAGETEGKQQGVRMAEAGREWAGKALRNEDFEVWFFRLLLEYGRVIDDNRATIGYSGS